MVFLKHLSLTLLFFPLLACSPYKVQHDYHEATDFTQFKHYAWASNNVNKLSADINLSSLSDERIRSAIELNLNKQGFRAAPSAKQADFLLLYHFRTTHAAQKGGVRPGVSVGGGSHGSFGGLSLSFNKGKGEQSLLTIDILNPHNNKLLWRGSTAGEFTGNNTPGKNIENIHKGVGAIIKKFPPK